MNELMAYYSHNEHHLARCMPVSQYHMNPVEKERGKNQI